MIKYKKNKSLIFSLIVSVVVQFILIVATFFCDTTTKTILLICDMFFLTVNAFLILKTINLIINPINKILMWLKNVNKGDLSDQGELKAKNDLLELEENIKTIVQKLDVCTQKNLDLTNELDVASIIQKSMLPCDLSIFSQYHNFDVYAVTKSAQKIGGDFYDFFSIDDTHMAVVIGDASGDGIAAALYMAVAKALIKSYTLYEKNPQKVFDKVNKQLCENNKAGMFVTAFLGILNFSNGEFIYSNAGHNRPLLYKCGDKFKFINTMAGFVLAGDKNTVYINEKLMLSADDVLCLYTDGVIEATNSGSEMFTGTRLKNTLNFLIKEDLSIKDVLKNTISEVKRFSSTKKMSDDMTMLILKYFGS